VNHFQLRSSQGESIMSHDEEVGTFHMVKIHC
jgi:hypothetical protein